MKLFALFLFLICSNAMAQGASCRQAVVLGHLVLGEEIDANSFSVNGPADFKLSPQEFNTLSAQEQQDIYLKFMPLETMVKNTTVKLESNISYIKRDSFMAYIYKDELEMMEDALNIINTCQYL